MSAPAKISLSSETLASREKQLRLLLAGASADGFELVDRASSDSQKSADKKESSAEQKLTLEAGRGLQRASGKSLKGLPPAIDVNMTFRRRVYFGVPSGANLVNVTPATLCGALGTVCYVANSTVAAICSMVRINSVTMWTPYSVSVIPVQCELFWAAGATNNTKEVDLVRPLPYGISNTGGMKFVPPADTLLDKWWKGSVTSSLFTVYAPTGSILLLDVEAQQSNVFAGPTFTVSTATLGAQYFLALDGPSSNKIVPIGLTTTS